MLWGRMFDDVHSSERGLECNGRDRFDRNGEEGMSWSEAA